MITRIPGIPPRSPDPLPLRAPANASGAVPHASVPHGAFPPLVPLVPAGAEITAELDCILAGAARAAHAGDRAARNALYFALEPKIARFVGRFRLIARARPEVWDLEDLAQEAFVVFAELIADWQPDESFGPYFLGHFPFRLRDAVRRLDGPRRERVTMSTAPQLPLVVDGSAEAAEAAACLRALARDLPPVDRAILLGHVCEGEDFAAIAARLGLHHRTVRRRWLVLRADLRRSLMDADCR